jgi:hypothetical protein
LSHCITQLIVGNNLWPCGWRRLVREHCWQLKWSFLERTPIGSVIQCLFVSLLPQLFIGHISSYPYNRPISSVLSISASTCTRISHPEDGTVRSSERSQKLGQIFINVWYLLYWVTILHCSTHQSQNWFTTNVRISLHFTEAAIIRCTFEDFGCVVLINIPMSGDILQLCLWILCYDGDVSCSHYVNFNFVSGHFLRRWPSYVIASKGAVGINCANGRTA